jgi:hypothetical protein
MLCSPDTRRNARILHDEYPVILDALILHIFRKLAACMMLGFNLSNISFVMLL